MNIYVVQTLILPFLRKILSISMSIVFEFLLRSLVGVLWLAALLFTTVLLVPVHFCVLISGALMEKPTMKSQWVW